jgi:hypothetical protein
VLPRFARRRLRRRSAPALGTPTAVVRCHTRGGGAP